ncbi:MAG: UbiA family prenyltransferase [Anaerolineae bacterium]|nr:UbiA family prenyltransferase [Anaerolineae bacterium]
MRNILSHGRVLMALLAGSMTAAAQAALGLPHAWRPLLIASLGTFVIYNLNHLWDVREDAINAPGRRAWRAHSASYWRVVMVLAAVGGLFLAGSGGQLMLLLTLILVAVGLAYSIPWPLQSGAPLRLKGKVGLNLVLIGAGWAMMGVGLPLVEAGASLALPAVLMALWVAGISGILATVFDLRDLPGDTGQGLGTLALLLGPAKARRFLMGWCALSAATIVGAVGLGFFPPGVLTAMLAPGAAFVWVARWPLDSPSPEGYSDGLLLAAVAASWLTVLALRVFG